MARPTGRRQHSIFRSHRFAIGLGFLQGSSQPTTHHFLVEQLQLYWEAASTLFRVTVDHVPAHTGIPGNERADQLAAKGRSARSHIGRFACFPAAPYSLTTFEQSSQVWDSLSFEDKNKLLADTLRQATSKNFPPRPLEIRRPHISQPTWEAIKRLSNGQTPPSLDCRAEFKRVKHMLKRDKKRHLACNLLSDSRSHPSQQWFTVKRTMRPFAPKPVNIKDLHGQLQPKHRRADCFAQYLRQKVWHHRGTPVLESDIWDLPYDVRITGPITLHEVNVAIRRLRPRRAPGPDGLHPECYILSPVVFRYFLAQLFTACFNGPAVPKQWMHSFVVMIPKSQAKPLTDLTNYRPISLTNINYKLYATILRARLQLIAEQYLRPTQFGFRSGRSVSQPVHVIRQILQLHERQQLPLHLVFLDWSKAFDSVPHDKILYALSSLDVPEPLANAIMSLYASPTFQVHDSGFTSDVHQQLGGVRQGCPLSPYLFVLCMSALFRHVELFYESHFSQIAGVINRPFPLWDLQYADDTVLLAHSPIALTRLLHTLQILALDFGLELNFSKCEHIALHSCERIRFCPDLNSEQCPCNLCFGSTEPSNLVTLVTSASYLGAHVNDTDSSAEHIKNCLSKATAAAKLLGPFFRNQCISPSFRLLVYQSVVQSILLFTIESIVPTRAELVRLGSVHFRILRQIFGMKSSFFHRVLQDDFEPCSNGYLQQLANSQGRHIYTPSQLASTRRLQLLGHIPCWSFFRFLSIPICNWSFPGSWWFPRCLVK